MNAILEVVIAGAVGGLTGALSREKGYGKVLSLGCMICLDIGLGIAGAFGLRSLVSNLIGAVSFVDYHGTALIGAVGFVGICRLISARYFRSPTYRGMSRARFIGWHDKLTVKELASWKMRSTEQARSKSPSS
jgi:hypothetical protein